MKALFSLPSFRREPVVRGGLSHFFYEADGQIVRFHLRVEEDGTGLLLANASAAARLSQTGSVIAKGLLSTDRRKPDHAKLVQKLASRFGGATREQISQDVTRVQELIEELALHPERHSIRDLDTANSTVHRRRLSAPLVADVQPGAAQTTRRVLDKLFRIGVPQVVFHVERRLPSLVECVEHAEDLGMIAGVSGAARHFENDLDALGNAGLDHLDLLFFGPDEDAHEALVGEPLKQTMGVLRRAQASEIFVGLVVALVGEVAFQLSEVAEFAKRNNVGAVTLWAILSESPSGMLLDSAGVHQAAIAAEEEMTSGKNLRVIWSTPVKRASGLSVGEQVSKGPYSSSEGAIRVAANGDVHAPYGVAKAVGNLLTDDWQDIWSSSAFEAYRESVDDPERCDRCEGLTLTLAGCPDNSAHWAGVTS